METDLLVVCGFAFAAVFTLLSLLAVLMRVLVALFPGPGEADRGTDPAVLAAVTSAVTMTYPGTKVTRIEEVR